MRKEKLFKRVLSLALVSALTLSGLSPVSLFNNKTGVIDVEAAPGGAPGGGEACNNAQAHTGSGSGSSANIKGVGWKFSIIPKDSIFHKGKIVDINNNLSHFTCNKGSSAASFIIYDGDLGGNDKNIYIPKSKDRDDGFTSVRYYHTSDIKYIFPKIYKGVEDKDMLQKVSATETGDVIHVKGYSNSNGFLKGVTKKDGGGLTKGGTFVQYIEKFGKEHVITRIFSVANNVKALGKKATKNTPTSKVLKFFEAKDFSQFLICIEPVAIWNGESNKKIPADYNFNIALSFQDLLKDSGNPKSQWSYLEKNYIGASQNGTPSSYLGNYGSWTTAIYTAFRQTGLDFYDVNGVYGKKNGKPCTYKTGASGGDDALYEGGFLLYGQGGKGGRPYKVGVDYNVFVGSENGTIAEGKANASSTSVEVASSYNAVHSATLSDNSEITDISDGKNADFKPKAEKFILADGYNADYGTDLKASGRANYHITHEGEKGEEFENTSKLGTENNALKTVTSLTRNQWDNHEDKYTKISLGVYNVPLSTREKGSVYAVKNNLINNIITQKNLGNIYYSEVPYSESYDIELGNTHDVKFTGDTEGDNNVYNGAVGASIPYRTAKAIQGFTYKGDGDIPKPICVGTPSDIFCAYGSYFDDETDYSSRDCTLSSRKDESMGRLSTYGGLWSLENAEELAAINEVTNKGSKHPGFYCTAFSGEGDVKEKAQNKDDEEVQSSLGVSVSVMVKKNEVESRIAYATLDRDTGSLTYDGTEKKKYDVTSWSNFKVKGDNSAKGIYVYVAYANNEANKPYALTTSGNANGNKIFELCKENKDDFSSPDSLKKLFDGLGGQSLAGGLISVGKTIGVGSEADTNGKLNGYSILVLRLKGNVTKKSKIDLKDYELNYIYPSMLTDGNYSTFLDSDSYVYLDRPKTIEGCWYQNITREIDDFKHSWDKYAKATNKYKGNIIDKNKSLGDDKNILQYDKFTGGIFTTEEKVRKGHLFKDPDSRNTKFSLAVNLTRSSAKDKRVISTLTRQTVEQGVDNGIKKDYAEKNLGLKFGNKPNSTIQPAVSKRDSSAKVDIDLTDIFEWNVYYAVKEGGTLHTEVYHRYLKHVNWDGDCRNCDYNWDTGRYNHNYCCGDYSYDESKLTSQPASMDGERVKYDIKETVLKYETDSVEKGINNTKIVPESLQKTANGLGKSSVIEKDNLYKIAVVHQSVKASGTPNIIGFYPEVFMRAYSSTGDKITTSYTASGEEDRIASNYVTPHNLLVMGEKKREVQPSAMYVFKVNNASAVAATGVLTSDATAVGTNADEISDGKPVVYAGGDLTLDVKPNFVFDLYGYSLDMIEPSDSSSLKGSGNYNNIIADGSNVKNIWGNTFSKTDIKTEFDTWTKNLLKNHIGTDVTLTVNGDGVDKTYNNFTASLSKFNIPDSVAGGVYSIKVEKGNIVTSGTDGVGYQYLIKQIASDYDVTDSKAEEIFKNSDIWQSITRAIEDCKDDYNNSQKSEAIDKERDHWYDEQVKTFVIRRFVNTGIKVNNILVNDKLDYGAAPTAETGTESLDSYKKADAKWYLTLFLKKDGAKKVPDGFPTSMHFYEPKDYASLSDANNKGSIIINELYVDGADFVVPSASTYDMGN